MIRTAAVGGPDRVPVADHQGPQPDHDGSGVNLAAASMPDTAPVSTTGRGAGNVPARDDGLLAVAHTAKTGKESGPARRRSVQADQSAASLCAADAPEGDIDAAAVAAYRASLQAGQPLSERRLAQKFGKTSRRWARNRIAEATQPEHGSADLALLVFVTNGDGLAVTYHARSADLASARLLCAAECGRPEQADLSASAARPKLTHADERKVER